MTGMFWFRLIAWPSAVVGWCLVFLCWHSAICEDAGSSLQTLSWIVAGTMLIGALSVSYGLVQQERAHANAKDAGENVAESHQTR